MSKGLKIIEVDEFLKTRSLLFNSTKEGFNQLTQNEPTGQLIDHHLFNARKLRRFLTSHPDIVNSLLPGRLFENGEKSYETNDLEKQQWPCLPHELDILALLDHLHISNSNELHYSIKGLKSIGKIIKERQLICQELRSNIELLNRGYETIRQQIKSKAKALDSQIRVLQGDFVDLKEKFTNSILQITSKGIENYENTIKQSEIRQEHLKTVLTVAEERVDGELAAIRKEVKNARSRKYKLEGIMESQIASHDDEMTALQEKYDELQKTFDNEKEQMEEFQKKMATLWIEHEEMLTHEEAERERQRAADARDAAVTEACRVVGAYARAFLARKAAAATTNTLHRRRRERR